MKSFVQVFMLSGLALAAPPVDLLADRGLLGIKLGGSQLLDVTVASATLLAIGGSSGASPAPTAVASVTSAAASSTQLPITFSAPIQGSGVLSLNNLPALPPVLDKTLSGALGAVYGLMSGACNAQQMCTITVAGTIESLLVDGANYSTNTSVNAWCDGGHCYGSADITLTATAPFVITCDQLTGTTACSGTISGEATAIFTNGEQIQVWGWLTPSGYCQNGVCTVSISAEGDPMY